MRVSFKSGGPRASNYSVYPMFRRDAEVRHVPGGWPGLERTGADWSGLERTGASSRSPGMCAPHEDRAFLRKASVQSRPPDEERSISSKTRHRNHRHYNRHSTPRHQTRSTSSSLFSKIRSADLSGAMLPSSLASPRMRAGVSVAIRIVVGRSMPTT